MTETQYFFQADWKAEKLADHITTMQNNTRAEISDNLNTVIMDKTIPNPYSIEVTGLMELRLQTVGSSGCPIVAKIREAINVIPTKRETTELEYRKNGMTIIHAHYYPDEDN
jgi:hypothetical protein